MLRGNFGNFNFRLPDILFAKQNLPLQIRKRHDIIIHDGQRANSRRRQILNRRTANPASSHDQHMGIKNLLLPRPANIPEHNMASIAVELCIGKVQ